MCYKSQCINKRWAWLLSVICLILVFPLDILHAEKNIYPKLMGMNIGAKNYDNEAYQNSLTRLDIVILGFYPGWGSKTGDSSRIRDVVINLKKKNPDILVGQYTILNESYFDFEGNYRVHKDKITKINNESWWLKGFAGKRVSWTEKYPVYEVNFLEWSKPDADGKRYPEWIAEMDYTHYFDPVPEFDIWYFDNVMKAPRISFADWNETGTMQLGSSAEIKNAYRRAHAKEWSAARKLDSSMLFIGNADNDLGHPEYHNKLQGVFHEGLMGLNWSLEQRVGWKKMIERYYSGFSNTAPPHLVGFNVWGNPEDYRFFRYAFALCLMGDGYFSFTDKKQGYSSVPWFDGYNINLGKATDLQQNSAWRKGIYKRKFENGIVLLNPTLTQIWITLDKPYYRINGRQDRNVNNGKQVSTVTIPPKDGLVLTRTHMTP